MKHNLPIKIDLPEHFLDEEVRNGYTITPLMKKVWAVEIDLLFEFIRICDKYNLKWYAGGGTMLGAARHGGYIPWDDDIDLNLFREDYDKFCKVAPEELKYPYFFTDGTMDKGVFRAYAQIYNSNTTCIMANSVGQKRSYNQGISIDIFPIDNLPEDETAINALTDRVEKEYTPCHWLYGRNGIYIAKDKNNIKEFARHMCSVLIAHILWPFCKNRWPKRLLNTMRSVKNNHSSKIADLSMPPFINKRLWERNWYNGVIKLKFEWFDINMPSRYDDWLKNMYGDWHTFVVGTQLHQAGIYDPEKPYTDYVK